MKIPILILALCLFNSPIYAQESAARISLPISKSRWHPPSEGQISEIYDYTFKSFISTGVSKNDQIPSSLGKMLKAQLQAHVLGARYSISDKFGVRLTGSIADNHLVIQKRDGQEEDVFVQGPGDLKLQGVYSIINEPNERFEFSLGSTIPAGATDLVGPNGQPLSSRSQLGSGTFDAIPLVSYLIIKGPLEIRDKLEAVVHNGKNSSGYTKGDEFSDSVSIEYQSLPIVAPIITVSAANKQRLTTDHPLNFTNSVSKASLGSSTQNSFPDFGAPGWVFEGTGAIKARIPLDRSLPFGISVEAGFPIFVSGKSDLGIRNEWFAGTSISSKF